MKNKRFSLRKEHFHTYNKTKKTQQKNGQMQSSAFETFSNDCKKDKCNKQWKKSGQAEQSRVKTLLCLTMTHFSLHFSEIFYVDKHKITRNKGKRDE